MARFVLPALLLALLSACATTVSYIPNETNARMSLARARRILKVSGVEVVDNKALKFTQISFGSMGVRKWSKEVVMPLKGLQVVAGRESGMYHGSSVLEFPGTRYSRVHVYNNDGYDHEEIAAAIYVIQREAEKAGFSAPAENEDELFKKAAAAYLASAEKPALGEDARRFKVQAEAAVREKKFEAAVVHFAEALEVAPWWPAGRFNRALVLGELKEYPEAILEMKRYLRLTPDAENARSAQDTIYKWEGETKR